jgi:hypothetical protein
MSSFQFCSLMLVILLQMFSEIIYSVINADEKQKLYTAFSFLFYIFVLFILWRIDPVISSYRFCAAAR